MKNILIAIALTLGLASATFADDANAPSLPIIGNVITGNIAVSSTALRSVRVGIQNSKPSVLFNEPGFAPVILAGESGLATINGTAVVTSDISDALDSRLTAAESALSTAVYTTGAQSIAGSKTFSDPLTVASSVTVTGNDLGLGNYAANNRQIEIKGGVAKASRLRFSQGSGATDNWVIGAGAASETSTFEIFNGVGIIPLSIDKTSSHISINNGLTVSSATVTGNAFSVGGSTFVVSGGKVGVGTASPSTILTVSTTTNNAPSLTADAGVFEIVQSLTGTELQMGLSPTSPYPAWIQTKQPNNAGGTWPLALNPLGGNVGIGTTAPLQKLHVDGIIVSSTTGSNRSALFLHNANSPQTLNVEMWDNAAATSFLGSAIGGYGTVYTGGTAVNGMKIGNFGAAPIIFGTNNAENMRILSGGNVGIGTTAPATLLDVNGTAQFGSGVNKSTFTAAGFLTMGGALRSQSKTMAQLLAISPGAVGEQYFCSDCSPAKLVVSTGTAAGNFADAVGGTFQ